MIRHTNALLILGAVLSIAVALSVAAVVTIPRLAQGEIDSAKCDVETVTMKTVGADISSTILSAAGNRAWARIQQVRDVAGVATSTVSLSFDEGAAATVNGGLQISTSTPSIEFGRNADLPYVGAVTGITNAGSTTVRVTECLY